MIPVVVLLLMAGAVTGTRYNTYIDKMNSWWPPTAIAQGIADPDYASNNEYDTIMLSFINSSGTADLCTLWKNPVQYFGSSSSFGSSNDQIQTNLKNSYNSHGKKVILVAFGSTEKPISAGLDATTTCSSIAQFVKNNHLDGLDIDVVDNDGMDSGKGE